MNRELWTNRRDYFAEMLREEAADEDRWAASHQHKPAARLEWAANDAATLRALADQIAALQVPGEEVRNALLGTHLANAFLAAYNEHEPIEPLPVASGKAAVWDAVARAAIAALQVPGEGVTQPPHDTPEMRTVCGHIPHCKGTRADEHAAFLPDAPQDTATPDFDAEYRRRQEAADNGDQAETWSTAATPDPWPLVYPEVRNYLDQASDTTRTNERRAIAHRIAGGADPSSTARREQTIAYIDHLTATPDGKDI